MYLVPTSYQFPRQIQIHCNKYYEKKKQILDPHNYLIDVKYKFSICAYYANAAPASSSLVPLLPTKNRFVVVIKNWAIYVTDKGNAILRHTTLIEDIGTKKYLALNPLFYWICLQLLPR